MAVAAAAGAVGLAGGGIDMGPEVTGRFPGHSPVLAGSALAVVVALGLLAGHGGRPGRPTG